MDIVTRLKAFIATSQISVTQFADTARIPRPSLSQLLNGRNKKVSDEVINKIHTAFPNLNMMWLLFGEGEMTDGSITPTITPQNNRAAERPEIAVNKQQINSVSDETTDNSQNGTDQKLQSEWSDRATSPNMIDFSGDFTNVSSSDDIHSETASETRHEQNQPQTLPGNDTAPEKFDSQGLLDNLQTTTAKFDSVNINEEAAQSQSSSTRLKSTISFTASPENSIPTEKRSIVNIIIYYSDNSYESFVPESDAR